MAGLRPRRIAALAGALATLACGDTTEPPDVGVPDAVGIERTAPGAPGRWSRRRAGSDDVVVSEEERERIARLGAIGYLDGSRQVAGRGLARHDPEAAFPGVNLYTSGHAPEAVLMDMEGHVLHRWRKPFEAAFSGAAPGDEQTGFFRRAQLLPGGDLLVIYEGRGIARLDRDSRVVWAVANGAHHDLEVARDGAITVLVREVHRVERIDPDADIFEDFVVRMTADGVEQWRVSVLEALERSALAGLWSPSARSPDSIFFHDIFHTNSVHVLDGSIPMPELAAGNVMVSLLSLDTIAVIDPLRGEMVWGLKGRFRRQHDPSVVAPGHLMLFDNRGGGRASAVLELDPSTARLVWRYPEVADPEALYSETCGAAQRLPNGNTLITESDAGRAIEVTREGRVVWEYFNPHLAGEGGEYVATLFELQRLPVDPILGWLRATGSQEADR